MAQSGGEPSGIGLMRSFLQLMVCSHSHPHRRRPSFCASYLAGDPLGAKRRNPRDAAAPYWGYVSHVPSVVPLVVILRIIVIRAETPQPLSRPVCHGSDMRDEAMNRVDVLEDASDVVEV